MELPIVGQLTPRERAAQQSGAVVRNPADEKLYPVPGQGIHKHTVEESLALPIIEVQHLNSAPTLKSWIDSQEGEPLNERHAPVVKALKNARANGAPINLNVKDGHYDLAFSGANGNMVTIEDFCKLMDAGLSLGECLRVTKLVCGPNGNCGNPGPCAICRDIRDGCYTDAAFEEPPAKRVNVLPVTDPIDEEINFLVTSHNYQLHGGRVVNAETNRSAAVEEVKHLCRKTGKGVIYVLEMLGVFRATEAASNTALKRGDLGGH